MPACNLSRELVRRLAATARNVSRIASRVDATLATAFFACLVQARPQRPRDNEKGDRDLKRGIRVCGFGLERLPWPGDGLFASSTP